MEKPADTKYNIHDLLRRRWSPRAFSAKPVEKEKLLSLLEAARWAPSAYNEQPWHFIVATKDNKEEFDRLLGCLVEFNQQWAGQAAVLILTVAKMRFERNQKPNCHALHDVGLAAANLVIQAVAMGLAAHQMSGFSAAKVRKVFAIPEGYEPVTVIAVGYSGDTNALPAEMRQAELAARTRRPLQAFVFAGRWGQASPLLSGQG